MLNHFRIEELVPPDVYEARHWQSWQLIDPVAAQVLDTLREFWGPLTVNDWLWGGEYTQSGFRSPDSDVGAALSQHRFGRAFDVKTETGDVQALYDAILADEAHWREKGLTVLEDIQHTPTWLHFDVRWIPGVDGITIVQP